MNKKVSIATLSAFLVATSPAMAVNEANTLYVNLELSLNRTTVGLVIQSISEQTGYEFSYDESILSKEEFYKLKYCSTVVYMVPRA